jgi:hypothetical protein
VDAFKDIGRTPSPYNCPVIQHGDHGEVMHSPDGQGNLAPHARALGTGIALPADRTERADICRRQITSWCGAGEGHIEHRDAAHAW